MGVGGTSKLAPIPKKGNNRVEKIGRKGKMRRHKWKGRKKKKPKNGKTPIFGKKFSMYENFPKILVQGVQNLASGKQAPAQISVPRCGFSGVQPIPESLIQVYFKISIFDACFVTLHSPSDLMHFLWFSWACSIALIRPALPPLCFFNSLVNWKSKLKVQKSKMQ